MKIVLDPGHTTGYNKYPAPCTTAEGTQMYILASYLAMQLKAKGYEVQLTRSSITDPDLLARGNQATNADLFISLHSNACETPTVDRVVVIPTITNKEHDYRRFCQDLGDSVMKTMGISQKTQIYERTFTEAGIVKDYYGVIRNAVLYGKCKNSLIVEHGFHTNPYVASWLSSSTNLNTLAKAEAELIAQYYPLPNKNTSSSTWFGYNLKENVTVEILRDILTKTGVIK